MTVVDRLETVDETKGAVRILMVDDKPGNLVALEAILDSPGYELTAVTSGQEALRRVMEDDFAVILLDVKMPGLDGIETARRIREREDCRDAPIIFISAYGDAASISDAYGVGAVDYITKPFEPSVLRSRVAVFAELYRARQAIKHMAYYDGLTGLPNRRLLDDRLAMAIASAERTRTRVAVSFIDIDLFKWVNDTHGHSVGDLLLQAVARRLGGLMRKVDTLARFGGDEFLIVLPGINATAETMLVAQRVIDSFEEPFVIEGRTLHVATSIGIAEYPEHATDSKRGFRY